jgi:hypothetical protein
LQKLHAANLKVKMEKSMFHDMLFEFLGYHTMTSGNCPLTSKVEAIQQLKLPKILKQLRSLSGLIHYYRNMWKQRSHILTLLTESTKVPSGSKSHE